MDFYFEFIVANSSDLCTESSNNGNGGGKTLSMYMISHVMPVCRDFHGFYKLLTGTYIFSTQRPTEVAAKDKKSYTEKFAEKLLG